MNKFVTTLIAAAAAVAVAAPGLASVRDDASLPAPLPKPAVKAAAQGAYDVAEIYCATIRWPTFKKGGRDPFVTTGGGDGTTYCYISLGLFGTFLVY
jgi:hypothetical protein